MVNVALIGCGYWGPNLLRNFMECPESRVSCVADLEEDRLAYVRRKYPSVHCSRDFHDAFHPDIDAVVIATPAATHYPIAEEALRHGKHVLVEKPLTLSDDHARALVELAEQMDLKLAVGHTFEYNSAVRELRRQLSAGTVGHPYYIYSQRLNFGIVRTDVNALWNLAPHDISILIYLLDSMPLMVSARGYDFIQKGIEDVIFLVLHFPGNIVAHVHVSWLDPGKMRRMTVVGSEKMLVYDDMEDTKIKIYDKGIRKQNISDTMGPYDNFGAYQLIKSAGSVSMPKIEFTEPLKEECGHFIDCVLRNRRPQTDGFKGWQVVRVLEAAQQSMDNGGKSVFINKEFLFSRSESPEAEPAFPGPNPKF